MFDRGAAALQAALPRLPHVRTEPRSARLDLDVFVCPLCLEIISRGEAGRLLRQEHAPPHSVGGAVVTLTCFRCNSAAGPVQAHAHKRWLWDRFNAGVPGSNMPVRVSVDEARVTADIELTEDSYFIVVDPNRSNPAHHENIVGQLHRGGLHFEVTGSTGFVPAKAAASDLRDAYLLTFALLGYRFVMWEDLQPIRDLIAAGASEPLLSHRSDDFVPTFEGILVFSSPVECVCVVRPGGRCVFLPWPNKSNELADWLHSGLVSAKPVGPIAHRFPRTMPMLLDLPPNGSPRR